VGAAAGTAIKKSVLELGGSDPFVVLADADLASVATGARLLAGGHRLEGPGNFYAPTVLAGVAPGQPAYDEEIFGPVAGVIVADDEDEAVRIANDTRFGLGASVWTADPGIAVARRIRSGAVFVNAVVASDVRMPFGGTRASGYGRELAAAGIREFVNVRTWWVLDEPTTTAPASE
jgi:succinate-semialdehyde dehydrogenase/glutarate-semialdehyde dehydrogenase